MTQAAIDVRALAQAGMAALRAGDAAGARARFDEIVAAGKADASVHLALASACKLLKDYPAMSAPLDAVLALEPFNLRALILKGDCFVAQGDARAAQPFYNAAVELAARAPGLPAELREEVAHAEAERRVWREQLTLHLRESVAAAGYDASRSSRRFTHSLDLLTGAKQLYLQEPRAYLFPELPHIQFYERERFPWLDAVEAATDDICGELSAVMQDAHLFTPYITADPRSPTRSDHPLLDKLDWSACFLWKNGAETEVAARCPKTMAALSGAPLARIKGRSPSILFSLLRPGAHITPHSGFMNARLICHLPLIVPPACTFRVGNDVRSWEKGKALVFDDTIEHEAKNASDQIRVVLIFDIWRPELTEEERSLVTALMEAVDAYGGGAAWTA